jgi:hypothetical protein
MIRLKFISKLKILGERVHIYSRLTKTSIGYWRRRMSSFVGGQDEYSRYQASLSKLNQLQMIPSGKTNGHLDLITLRLTHTKNMCNKLKLTV